MFYFQFHWPSSQPIKKTGHGLTGAAESHSHSTRATGRAAAAPARVGSNSKSPTQRPTEAPGSRQAEAAGSSGRAHAAAQDLQALRLSVRGLPDVTLFKLQRPYRRKIVETFKDFPPTVLALLDTLLAIEPSARGTVASALDSEVIKQLSSVFH